MLKTILISFVLLLTSCVVHVVEEKPTNFDIQAYESCGEFCKSKAFNIMYRDGRTYFCECYGSDGKVVDRVVVGKLGTIYK